MDPSADEMLTLTTVGAVALWTGMSELTRAALFAALGCAEEDHVRTIAAIPAVDFNSLVLTLQPAGVAATPTQRSQAGLLGRTCRVVCGVEPTLAAAAAAAAAATAAAAASAAASASQIREAAAAAAKAAAEAAHASKVTEPQKRKVKLSSVVSQVNDEEASILDEVTLNAAYKRYRDRLGDYPPLHAECTCEQLSGCRHF
jgi:hypothetical protein